MAPGFFSYIDDVASPGLHAVWPATGPATGGGEVALVVTGLASENAVAPPRFGGSTASLLSVLPGQGVVLATAPPGPPGQAVDVSVAVDGVTFTLPAAYRYVPALAVASAEPAEGPTGGGTAIAVHGVGFAQGPLEVTVGALPAANVTVVDDTTLHLTTPPGSPGFADIRVRAGEREGRLADGFAYRVGQPTVWAISPERGSIAGNTWAVVYGADLPQYAAVSFGDVGAAYVEGLGPTGLSVRTPRADVPATVNVRVQSGNGLDLRLDQAFTYFDPASRWGGTWGAPIDGSVNVTVIDPSASEPVEGATVLLGSEVPPRYLGYTDDRGQVTLSGPGLLGRQMVTAAKDGMSASTIVDFDAENVTLALTNPDPPAPGDPGGEPLLPGDVIGTVHGIGKYFTLPAGRCEDVDDAPPGWCDPCDTDLDCTPDAPTCTASTGSRTHCSATCLADADCPTGFVCAQAGEGGARCVPHPGRRQVRCFVSATSLFSGIPLSADENTLDVDAGESTFALSGTRLGDIAVYCIGGAYKVVGGEPRFRPVVMGVERHAFVLPGQSRQEGSTPVDPTAVDVTLDIPLTRSVDVVVEAPPLAPEGPHRAEVKAWIDLGSDGYIPLGVQEVQAELRRFRFDGLPAALSEDLYDAQFAFYAGALTDDPVSSLPLPTSEVLRTGLGTLDEGTYLEHGADGWREVRSGYPGDIYGLTALPNGAAFAATGEGTILHYDGHSWWPQPVPTGPALHAVAADLDGGALAVGDAGRVIRWDGIAWTDEPTPTDRDLRDVVATGHQAAVAVGRYVILERLSGVWSAVSAGPPRNLAALTATPQGTLWAVGAHGVVVHRDTSGAWATLDVPFHQALNDVFATQDGLVIAVGDGGGVLTRAADGALDAAATPTQRALHAVWGPSAADVWAVGDDATVVHFDGSSWSLVSEGGLETSLRAVVGLGPDQEALLAMGTSSVHLGPFVTPQRYTSPVEDGLWDRTQVSWRAEGGAEVSFHNYRIYTQKAAPAWTITAPGWLDTVPLPDLMALDGIDVLGPGGKTLMGLRVQLPGFDIDNFDNRVFYLPDWRAWSQTSVHFDSLTSSRGGAGTVPGF